MNVGKGLSVCPERKTQRMCILIFVHKSIGKK
jgi:hypothetical protein